MIDVTNPEALKKLLESPGVYAGIGSRETPSGVLTLMEDLARELGARGWRLRTGMAPGADQAFYRGSGPDGAVEAYLPWASFEAGALEKRERQTVSSHDSERARAIAKEFHPRWERLTEGARKLQARNSNQVLGDDLKTAADVIVCWTPDGRRDGRGPRSGGTGQALRIAHDRGIPVVNLARPEDRATIVTVLFEPLAREAVSGSEARVVDARDAATASPVPAAGVTRKPLPVPGVDFTALAEKMRMRRSDEPSALGGTAASPPARSVEQVARENARDVWGGAMNVWGHAVTRTGRLTSEPEPRVTPSGMRLCVLRVEEAHDDGASTVHRVNVGGADATASSRLRTGDVVEVTGCDGTRRWKGPGGRRQAAVVMEAVRVEPVIRREQKQIQQRHGAGGDSLAR